MELCNCLILCRLLNWTVKCCEQYYSCPWSLSHVINVIMLPLYSTGRQKYTCPVTQNGNKSFRGKLRTPPPPNEGECRGFFVCSVDQQYILHCEYWFVQPQWSGRFGDQHAGQQAVHEADTKRRGESEEGKGCAIKVDIVIRCKLGEQAPVHHPRGCC